MVSIGGGDKCHAVLIRMLSQIPAQAIAPTQSFERSKSKAPAFILDEQPGNSQLPGQFRKVDKWSRGVFCKLLMENLHLICDLLIECFYPFRLFFPAVGLEMRDNLLPIESLLAICDILHIDV